MRADKGVQWHKSRATRSTGATSGHVLRILTYGLFRADVESEADVTPERKTHDGRHDARAPTVALAVVWVAVVAEFLLQAPTGLLVEDTTTGTPANGEQTAVRVTHVERIARSVRRVDPLR